MSSGRVGPPTPTLLVTLLVALVLGGCGLLPGGDGDDAPRGPAATPAGFAAHTGPTFTIAHPQGWTKTNRPDDKGGPPVLLIQGPEGAGGFPPQIAVGHDTNYSSDFDDAMEIFRTIAIGKTGRVVADAPVRLAGAARAQRTEYTETQSGSDGRSYTIRVVELHALTPDRTMFDVLVRAPAEDFEAARLAQALDSFRVGTTS
jgi:hypothetical protein